jgi:serine protease Do/serine protease DegQ
MVQKVTAQLARFGEVRRGRFGATAQDVTPELARALDVSANEGAMLVDVVADAPAAKAGLKRGDVIVAMNGRPIRGSADLRNQLGLVPVGDVVELRFLRDGKAQTAKVTIEPPRTGLAAGRQSVPELVGAKVGNLERGGRSEAVVVVDVERGSAAWHHGLRAGDIIVGVNRRKVRSIEELGVQLRANPRPVGINILRGDFEITLVLRG